MLEKKHATFMIMGDACTRACAFVMLKLESHLMNIFEPSKIAKAVKNLNLKHVVITSVDRDDLDDGGSEHFAKQKRQEKKPDTSIEVLTLIF